MSIVCPACKQELKDKNPAFCSFCFHRFRGSKPLEAEPEEEEYVDLRNTTHPARQSFTPLLTKRYDLTGPIKSVLGICLLGFIAFVIYNYMNGGFYYEDAVEEANGAQVHVHHFRIMPRHNNAAKGAKKPAAQPSSAAPGKSP